MYVATTCAYVIMLEQRTMYLILPDVVVHLHHSVTQKLEFASVIMGVNMVSFTLYMGCAASAM